MEDSLHSVSNANSNPVGLNINGYTNDPSNKIVHLLPYICLCWVCRPGKTPPGYDASKPRPATATEQGATDQMQGKSQGMGHLGSDPTKDTGGPKPDYGNKDPQKSACPNTCMHKLCVACMCWGKLGIAMHFCLTLNKCARSIDSDHSAHTRYNFWEVLQLS